jgi:hypothetical protein
MPPSPTMLPVVKFRDKRTGQLLCCVNQTDYARDLSRWDRLRKPHIQIEFHGGNAGDLEVAFQKQQAEVELLRQQKPGHVASHDARRAYEARALGEINTGQAGTDAAPPAAAAAPSPGREPAEAPAVSSSSPAGASLLTDEGENPLDWPFFKLRGYVLKLTGKAPGSKIEAEALLREWKRRRAAEERLEPLAPAATEIMEAAIEAADQAGEAEEGE